VSWRKEKCPPNFLSLILSCFHLSLFSIYYPSLLLNSFCVALVSSGHLSFLFQDAGNEIASWRRREKCPGGKEKCPVILSFFYPIFVSLFQFFLCGTYIFRTLNHFHLERKSVLLFFLSFYYPILLSFFQFFLCGTYIFRTLDLFFFRMLEIKQHPEGEGISVLEERKSVLFFFLLSYPCFLFSILSV